MSAMKKLWNIISTALVVLIVICAVFLMGSRLLGYQVFTVISGSMEPEYSVGDLLYVKDVDVDSIQVGDPITFILNEDLVVATHRVVRIDAANQHFYTKGDDNETEDSAPVHFKNVIGVPQFSIPYLGYVSDYIQNPPGMYVTIAVGILLVILVFLPDFFGKKKKEETPANTGSYTARPQAVSAPKTCRKCKYYWTDVDLPHPVCRRHEFHFESDFTPCGDYEE